MCAGRHFCEHNKYMRTWSACASLVHARSSWCLCAYWSGIVCVSLSPQVWGFVKNLPTGIMHLSGVLISLGLFFINWFSALWNHIRLGEKECTKKGKRKVKKKKGKRWGNFEEFFREKMSKKEGEERNKGRNWGQISEEKRLNPKSLRGKEFLKFL